jgi:hypothetical protein
MNVARQRCMSLSTSFITICFIEYFLLSRCGVSPDANTHARVCGGIVVLDR